jgi:hypothetical protein
MKKEIFASLFLVLIIWIIYLNYSSAKEDVKNCTGNLRIYTVSELKKCIGN